MIERKFLSEPLFPDCRCPFGFAGDGGEEAELVVKVFEEGRAEGRCCRVEAAAQDTGFADDPFLVVFCEEGTEGCCVRDGSRFVPHSFR